jgi:hypothetical protein
MSNFFLTKKLLANYTSIIFTLIYLITYSKSEPTFGFEFLLTILGD